MVREVKGLDIKIARLKAGLHQYDLAARLGIAPSRLSEIESGRRKAAPEIVEQLFKILDERKQPINPGCFKPLRKRRCLK